MNTKRLAVVAMLLAVPGMASAMQLDYYTYNAFDEAVQAFTRCALIFSDTNFLSFMLIFGALGIAGAVLPSALQALAGGSTSPQSWMLPLLFGLILVRGLVFPTGRLNIYDPVLNAYQPVDGVPDIVIVVAGVLNKVERSIIDVVDTAGGTPFTEDAGNIDFSLINAAMQVPITDVNLDRSMSQYYTDCGVSALSTDTAGLKQQFLQGTNDQYDTFASFVTPALYTTFYPTGNDAGTTMTCTDAWTALAVRLNDPNTFTDMKASACKMAGYDPTQAVQATACETELGNATALYGVTATSSLTVLRSMALAKSVSEAMNSSDFSLQQRMLVDRETMAEGFGAAQAADQWIPKIRGFVLAFVLGLVPLSALFIATPLALRAVGLMVGMFLWLTIWGIMDAVAVVMIRDVATTAFHSIQNFHLGYTSILNTPNAAVQAIGVFGKARMAALTVATAASGALFHFSGLGQLAFGSMQSLERAGELAGQRTLLPEERSPFLDRVLHSSGAAAEMAAGGFGTAAAGDILRAQRGVSATRSYINQSLAGGMRPSGTAMAEGAIEGAGRVGSVQAESDIAASRGTSLENLSWQRSGAQAAYESGRVLGEMDQAGGAAAGVYKIGHTHGATRAADAQLFQQLYENINHTSAETPQGWYAVQEQLQGSALALSQIGNTPGYIQAQEQFYRASIAAGALAASRPGSAEAKGAAQELESILHAEGFSKAVRLSGEPSLVRGQEYSLVSQAAVGDAAAEAGGVGAVATELGRMQIAQGLSNARVTEGLAAQFGYDAGTMAGLLHFSEDRDGSHVSMAITPENKERVIGALQGAGLLSAFGEEQLRHQPGGELSLSYDAQGQAPVTMTLRAGSSTLMQATDNVESGWSVSHFATNTNTTGRSVTTQGAAAQLEVDQLQQGFINNFDFNTGRAKDPAGFASWTAEVGHGFEQLGIRGQAESFLNHTHSIGVSGQISAEGGPNFGVGKIGGGASASGDWRRTAGDATTTSQDLNILAAQKIVEDAGVQARAEYEKANGAGSAVHAVPADLASRAAVIAHQKAEDLIDGSVRELKPVVEKNDALTDSGVIHADHAPAGPYKGGGKHL